MIRSGLVGLALLLAGSAANAASFDVTAYGAYVPPGASPAAPGSGYQIDDFESGGAFGYAGSYWAIRPGPTTPGNPTCSSGQCSAAPPTANNSHYMAVFAAASNIDGLTVTGFGPAKAIGLFWGSIDTYNEIEFFSGNTSLGKITGTQAANENALPGGANGTQSPGTDANNKYVVILLDQLFDKVVFRSIGSDAFEFDSFAIYAENSNTNPVPVPGAIALFAGGLGVIGLLSRRRRKALAAA